MHGQAPVFPVVANAMQVVAALRQPSLSMVSWLVK
jgi:hypothetical protein